MEEKKNNKGLVWLIVVLIILVLGLVGYIVYDKVLKEEPKKVEQSKEETEEIDKQIQLNKKYSNIKRLRRKNFDRMNSQKSKIHSMLKILKGMIR